MSQPRQTDATIAELAALNARFIHNLKRWATGYDPKVVLYWDTRDEMITVVGDVALVRATNKHTERTPDGRDVAGMTTDTDTYVREGGTWLCIQAQLTPVAPDTWPSDDTIVSVYVDGKKIRSPA
jgi:hypothetical protein